MDIFFLITSTSFFSLDVALVGGIQRHLQLSDGDGHLLLDHLNLILQPGLGLSKPPAKNVDLIHQLLLVRLVLAPCSTESLLKLGLQLGNLLLQELHLAHSLCLLVIRLLVSPGKLKAEFEKTFGGARSEYEAN